MAKNKANQPISTQTALFGPAFAYVSQLFSPVLLFVLVLSLFAPFIPTEVSANHTGIVTTATIDSNTTWTVPAGISQYTLKIWGPGGNGGNGGALGVQGYNGPGGGGGGGAGAYGEKTILVTPATQTVTASIAPDNTSTTTITVGGMTLSVGPGGNGGVGLEYSGGGKKQGIAYGGPGGIGGLVDPVSVGIFDFSQNGANGAQGTPGGYANSMSGYGFPGAGGAGADGYSVLASGGVGGADPSGNQSYSGGNHPGTVGNGFGGGGGGGSGYSGQGALGARGRLVVEYSVPIPDPVVPPTISCSATAGVLDTVSFGLNTILSWSTNTPTTTVLEISNNLTSWSLFPNAPTISGSCYTVTASTTNALAQTNYFRLTATTTPVVPVIPPLPPVGPSVTCDATAGVLSALPQGMNTILSWSTSTPTTTILQSSIDFVNWTNFPTAPTTVGSCFTVTASTTNATGQVNFFRLNTPVVVPPAAVPVTLKDLTLVGPLTDATLPLSINAQQVSFNLSASTEVMVVAYANTVIPNSVASTITLSLDGTPVDSAVISDAAISGGGTASVATLTTHNTALAAGNHVLNVSFPGPGYINGAVKFYVYKLATAVSQVTADMAIVGPLSTTTADATLQKVTFTVPTTSDVLLYGYVNAGIPNSVSAPVRMLLNGAIVDSATISDAANSGGTTRSVFTLVARRTLTAGTYELSSEVPAPGYIQGFSKFYVQYLNPAPTDPTTLAVTGPLVDASYTGNTQAVQFTLATPADVLVLSYAPVTIPNSVASTVTLSLDGTPVDSAVISDAAISGGGTRSVAALTARQMTLASGTHTVSLAFPSPGSFGAPAQFYIYRLQATSTPVVPPIVSVLPTCSATPGVLSITASSTNSILTWATTTPLALVAQRSTDLVNWTTITLAHPVINNCFSVTASTTDAVTGLPNNFRLFDTTPIAPPANLVSCPTTPGVLALAASSTNSILTWASTTPVALVAQSSTDLTNWTTLTLTPPIVNNCFTVVASTTASNGSTNFFRLFNTTSTGGGGGGGGGSPTLTVGLAISGATTTAPINNLPFAITLGGTAIGPVFYRFDCTSDGVYEFASSTALSSFVTPGICTYTTPGTYTALAEVGRNGATTTATTVVTVLAGTTIGGLSMSLNFTVSPASGVAPLNNVGFSGTVAGTAVTGVSTTTFSFDCLNDGSYEFSSSTLSTSMTQGNLCSYTNPGTYVARLLAVRDTFMVSATTSVTVSSIPIVPPTSGAGGGAGSVTVPTGGGGGGGGPIGLFGTITPQPTTGGGGTIPQPVSGGSCSYLDNYLRVDFDNNATEVAKLQTFLKDTEKMDVSLTNVFDKQTEDAVKAFQIKYSADILAPWGVTEPTGYVYITTLKKINDIHCAGQTGYVAAPTPDLTGYYAEYQAGTTTVSTPFGDVNIAPSTATGTRPFDGIIGIATSTVSDTLALATTTESFFSEGTLIRGQQNVATVLNAISDIVLYVLDKIDGAFIILLLATLGFLFWIFGKKDKEEKRK